MTHVASLKFHGGESLEILYNVMQRPDAGCEDDATKQHRKHLTGLQDFIFSVRYAHLIEIRKLQLKSKNLVHKGVDFYVQNALKLIYEHL